MKKFTRDESVVKAVEFAKKSNFGATAIKIECEAQFNRGRGDDDYCIDCDGDGYYYDSNDDRAECSECGGSGRVESDDEYGSNAVCHDYILERLVPLGLAEESSEGYSVNYDTLANRYKPTGALVYSKFYEDGSVDSEWTFTLSLEDPRVVLLLPQLLEVFKDLGNEISGEFDITGAGMHMAWINSEDCSYPYNIDWQDDTHRAYLRNFKRNMKLLMPALFFLGSADNVSRSMHYRRPGVAVYNDGSKYFSIYYNGALEYRVFETCYDKPEAILDNVVVMSKTLRYWSLKSHNLAKITTEYLFGNDRGRDIERLYQNGTLLDLLNAGLRILKPDYQNIGEVKKARGFKTTKRTFAGEIKKWQQDARISYKEYEYRHQWSVKQAQLEAQLRVTRAQADFGTPAVPITDEEFQERTNQYLLIPEKKDIAQFVSEHINRIQRQRRGEYTISI